MPLSLKSCPKSNKSPYLFTLYTADLPFDWLRFSSFAYVELDRDLQVLSNSSQSNRRSDVQWYFPLWSKWVFSDLPILCHYLLVSHFLQMCRILYEFGSKLLQGSVEKYSLFWISPHSCSRCYKNFFGGNLDFPKIKILNKVCSNVWTCTKMWKLCNVYAKQYSKTVHLFLLFWPHGKSRDSRFPPKKVLLHQPQGGDMLTDKNCSI